MSISRKHYEAIAKSIADHHRLFASPTAAETFAIQLGRDVLVVDNPRFDILQFGAAVRMHMDAQLSEQPGNAH